MKGDAARWTHLLTGRDVVGRDVPAHDLVDALGVLARLLVHLHRLDEANDARVLAGTAELFLVRVEEVRALGDRLAEGDARLAGRALDVVLALHALYIDLEVELAHAGDDGLGRCVSRQRAAEHDSTDLLALPVDVDAERRILFLETVECAGEVGCLLADGLQCQGDDRFRDEHVRLYKT